MPNFKCTWFFQDTTYNVGFTETWWADAADHDSAEALVHNYVAKRMDLAQDTTFFVNLRIAKTDTPRDSKYYPPASSTPGTINSGSFPVAGVWDCLLIRRDVATYNRFGHIFMHLVPRGIFTGRLYTGILATTPTWLVRYAAWNNEVTGGSYQLRFKSGSTFAYAACVTALQRYRTERRLGRPSDPLRGRRAIA